MTDRIRVVATDLLTGEEESCEIQDDYVLICAGSAYRAHVEVQPVTGIHVITVKGVRGLACGTQSAWSHA